MISRLLRLLAPVLISCAVQGPAATAGEHRFSFDQHRIGPQGLAAAKGGLTAEFRGTPRVLEGAMFFDGKQDHLAVEQALAEIDLPTEKISAEAWVMVMKSATWGAMVAAIQDNGEHERGFLLGYRGDRFCFAVASEGAGRLTYLTAEEAFETGRWYHVAGSYDGAKLEVFVDGDLAASTDAQSGALLYGDSQLVLGAYRDQDEFYPLEGMLHEVAVYDRAISAAQWKRKAGSLDRSSLPPPPQDLYGPFLQVGGPSIEFVTPDTIDVRWDPGSAGDTYLEFGAAGGIAEAHQGNGSVHIPNIQRHTTYRYRIRGRDAQGQEVATESYSFDSSFNYAPQPDPQNGPLADAATARLTQWIRSGLDTPRGYALVLGATQGILALELARQTELDVVVVEPELQKVDALRRMFDSSGMYGQRISVIQSSLDDLPFGGWLFNLVLSETVLDGGSLAIEPLSLLRWLRPCGGRAIFGTLGEPATDPLQSLDWSRDDLQLLRGEGELQLDGYDGTFLVFRRGALPDTGEWTHQYGRPDNAACSDDGLIGGELEVQWWGRPGPRPMPDRGPRNPAPLYSNGRMFVQGDRTLFGIDAYNGSILWSKQMPTLRRANLPRTSSNMAADADGLYVAIGSSSVRLDGDTGASLARADVPTEPGDPHCEWGFLAVVDDHWIGTATPADAQYLGDNGEWYNDFSGGQVGRVASISLFCLDRDSGELRWQYRKGTIINSSITLADSRVFFIESQAEATPSTGRLFEELGTEQFLVCLDRNKGKVIWRRPFDLSACEYMTYLAWANDVLLVTGSDRNRHFHLYAIDANSAKPLWDNTTPAQKTHHSGWLMHPVIVEDHVYVNKHCYQLRTGEVLSFDPFDFHGCGVAAASRSALFHRFEFHGMLDLQTGERTEFLGVRGGCWLGQIPAGGMLLAPESSAGCSCAHSIQTSMAFRPARLDRPRIVAPEGEFVHSTRVEVHSPLAQAEIRYTLDGSRPHKGSDLYRRELEIDRSTTLNARLFVGDSAYGEVTTQRFERLELRRSRRAGARKGLKCEAYSGNFDRLPDFDSLEPLETQAVALVDTTPSTLEERYALRFRGYFEVPEDGLYTLHLTSDDGSALWLGEDLVIDNDGLHGAQTRSARLALQRGWHPLTVTFFESTGGQALSLEIEAAGEARVLLEGFRH